jgi:hypothetical protein
VYGLAQILVDTLLLYQHVRLVNPSVYKTGIVEVHLVLKRNHRLGLFHPEHIAEQRQPERLTLSFFVTSVPPLVGKVFGSLALLYVFHLYVHLKSQCKYKLFYRERRLYGPKYVKVLAARPFPLHAHAGAESLAKAAVRPAIHKC